MSVGLSNSLNVQLLDSSGEIPDARIKTTIARVSQIPTDTSDLTNGAGYITSASVSSLTDTDISSLTSGQYLMWDGTAWKNTSASVSVALSDLTDVTITSATSGQALLYDGSKWVNGSAGVSATYDAVNERITFA